VGTRQGEQATNKKILIRDGDVVVVADSVTGWPRSLLVLMRSVTAVECR
jgi:hypothetical protein